MKRGAGFDKVILSILVVLVCVLILPSVLAQEADPVLEEDTVAATVASDSSVSSVTSDTLDAELNTDAVSAEDFDETSSTEEDRSEDEEKSDDDEELYSDLEEETPFDADPGITPDSVFYVVDEFMEGFFDENDPANALAYKEEKIAEAKAMIEDGNVEDAQKALDLVKKYGDILEREVSPELEREARESSRAVNDLLDDLEEDLEGEEWEDIKKEIAEHKEREKRIALAAKISSKIKDLCESLADLDPQEYARICKTNDDAPQWQRDLDDDLTEEQKQEAELFFEIMSECFQSSGRECRCEDIPVKPFADKCSVVAPLAAACEDGDEDACDRMDAQTEDMGDLLPDYLQDVMGDVEQQFGEDRLDMHMPPECRKEGATTPQECMKVMFKLNAPEECQEALERGEIDISNEREARKACEEIMFTENAPEECIAAGLRDHKKCAQLEFKNNAPEECLEAGLDGSGRNDWKACDKIQFRLNAPEICLDAGLTGGPRDWKKCDAIRFKEEAPEACVAAGLDPSKDRRAWDKCQEIEFRENAPEECVSAGLKGTGRDWEKCQKISFEKNADQRCLEQGIDGSDKDDWRKCEELTRGEEDVKNVERMQRSAPGPDCRSLEDPKDRLDCYDGLRKHYEEKNDEQRTERDAPDDDNYDDEKGDDRKRNDRYDRERGDKRNREFRMPPECEGLAPEECMSRMRDNRPDDSSRDDFPGNFPRDSFPEGENFPRDEPSSGAPESTSSSEGSSSSGDSGSSSGGESSGGVDVTGGAVLRNNDFLNYYYRK